MTTSLERVTPLSQRSGIYKVQGSQGATYLVDRNCTCPGFRYRRHCKHVELVKEFQMSYQAQLESDLQSKIEELYK